MGKETTSRDNYEVTNEWLSWRANSKAYESTLGADKSAEYSELAISNQNFQYRPLEDSQIRLLKLFPCPSSPGPVHRKPLYGILEHVPRDASPSYAALSYTWGEPTKVETISLEGQSLGVGQNLAEALFHLRETTKTLTIWIDAICINQEDEVEKSRQVNLMGIIFRQAALVIAWLGPAAHDSNLALRKVFKIGQAVYSGLTESLKAQGNRLPAESVIDLIVSRLTVGEDEEADVPVTAVLNLFTRSWWQRLWIIQEMALAKSVLFVCGKDEIPSMYLQQGYASISMLNRRPIVGDQITTETALKLEAKLSKTPIAMLNSCHGGLMYRNRPLEELLSSTLMLSATNPRDRIFAVLGIASDAATLGIRADYSKSTEEVYIDAVTKLLCAGELSILSRVRHPKILSDMPTWVPDFSESPKGGNFISQAKISSITQRNSAGIGDWPADCSILPDNLRNILCVTGVPVGKITHVNHGIISNRYTIVQASGYLMGVEIFARSHATAYTSEEELAEVIWRFPIGNTVYSFGSESAGERTGRPGLEIYQCYRAVRGLNVPPSEPNPEDWRLRNGMPYLRLMTESISNKISFVSSNGYLGYGTPVLQDGDHIVVFYGAEMPFILRSAPNGRYTLVGEAYVHGIMFGEFLRDNPASVMFELV